MKAAVVRSVDGPFLIEELQDPRPKSDEVLIKVAACGVCHTDLHIHDGSVPFPMPCVLGHEISGEILELGEAWMTSRSDNGRGGVHHAVRQVRDVPAAAARSYASRSLLTTA